MSSVMILRRQGIALRRLPISTSFLNELVADGTLSLSLARTMSQAPPKCLNMTDLNPQVKLMEYAVRGPLVIRAAEIEKELEKVSGCQLAHTTLSKHDHLGNNRYQPFADRKAPHKLNTSLASEI